MVAIAASLVLGLLAGNSAAAGTKKATPKPARAKPARPKVVDVPGLPRVLIIGDSISIGYTRAVQEALKGKINVHRIPGNAQHTGTGLKKLDAWLGPKKWDAIHFNWGLWDLCYRHPDSKVQGRRDKVNGTITLTIEQYEKNLRALVKRLKATKAKLIWASTTPVPENEAGRFQGDEVKYNAVAKKIMLAHGVAIDDLHAHVRGKFKQFAAAPGNVHLTPEGYRYLARKVAASILEALRPKPATTRPTGVRQDEPPQDTKSKKHPTSGAKKP